MKLIGWICFVMFLRQVALTKGTPFDLRVSSPIDYDSLTDEELDV